MAGELTGWDAIAEDWGKWRVPLRPSEEDVRILKTEFAAWAAATSAEAADVLLLGVTPEIMRATFPVPVSLLGMDRSSRMVLQWGTTGTDRRCEVGDWFALEAPASRDVVLSDGSFVFYDPSEAETLAEVVRSTLRESGVYIGRHFVLPEQPQSVGLVLHELRKRSPWIPKPVGGISTFGEFKFRMAMALQTDPEEGVRQGDVYDAIQEAGVDFARETNFPAFVVSTLEHYRDSDARLYFPTKASVIALLQEKFAHVAVVVPTYPFGALSPFFVARAS